MKKTMKIAGVLFMVFLLMASIVPLSVLAEGNAIGVVSVWTANDQEELTVEQGEDAELIVFVNSVENFNLRIDLLDRDSDLKVDTVVSLANIPANIRSLPFNARFVVDTAELVGEYRVNVIVQNTRGSDLTSLDLDVTAPEPVIEENRPPVFDEVPDQEIDVGELLEFQVTATDPDGDELTYIVEDLPEGASFQNQLFSWTPAVSQAGVYTVYFIVDDGNGGSDLMNVRITVSDEVIVDANSAPVLQEIDDMNTRELSTLNIPVTATDRNGDEIELKAGKCLNFFGSCIGLTGMFVEDFTFVDNGDGTGMITFSPQTDFVEHPSTWKRVKYFAKATDSEGASTKKTFDITVNDLNQNPVFTSQPVLAAQVEREYTYRLSAVDLDNEDGLTFNLAEGPAGMFLNENTLFWTPGRGEEGNHRVVVSVTDNIMVGSVKQEFVITVANLLDEDNDGVADVDDLCPGTEEGEVVDEAGCSDNQVDPDGDGYCNFDAPTDGPSDCAEQDNCPLVYNPDQDNIDGDDRGDACDDDDDNDGVADAEDNCPAVPNGDQPDADNDGLGDACDNDDDNDNVVDPIDNCQFTPNPDQIDTDNDNVGDACDDDDDGDQIIDVEDNCPLVSNSDQADGDGDGLGDACDDLFDTDGDGIPDDRDNCPLIPNEDQLDSDRDGMGDVCDPLPFDKDNDGIPDDDDNCPATPNPDQLDSDGDGIGDVCDWFIHDFDNDGIPDDEDNCPLIPNMDQMDSDGDGLGDVCDPNPINDRPMIVSAPVNIVTAGEDYRYQLNVVDPDDDADVRYVLVDGPPGMEIDDTGLITWTPGSEDDAQVTVAVYDGMNTVLHSYKLVVRETYKNVRISSAQVMQEVAYPGEYVPIHVRIVNNGDDEFRDMKIRASIYDLGIRRASREFDLESGESNTENIYLQLPYYSTPGEYLVEITVSNSHYHDNVYRQVTII